MWPVIKAMILSSHSSGRPVNINSFISLGDSYSAGIGTPLPPSIKENACRQGNGAYPYLLALDLLPPNSTTNDTNTFQWLSCTGSTTADILSSPSTGNSSQTQIDTFTTFPHTPDFATLSIGGNDLGFFDVMNACVFRFYSFYSGTCEAALAASDAAIQSPEFELRLKLVLREILDKIRWEKHPDFFIAVTGYARFFDTLTEGCNNASLGVWWGGGGQGTKLTTEGAVEGVNAMFGRRGRRKVMFVDFDDMFKGHRFCEEGVEEPDYERQETWFFLPGGGDKNERNGTGGEDWKGMELLEDGSVLVHPERCLEGAERSGDWGERALCYMAIAKKRDPSLRLKEGMVGKNSMWYVPTYYGKTFHPRSLGHGAIRGKMYEVWREHGIVIEPRR
ncbi:SGNH hydrolase-type esterase domain-containing protein [Lasiosphaeria hispida]|uniref:SGNH hydrolase-type esterase domain-containing protein n=1 Tax=Lasiosphaeria hispida TaxID=260671 RepID=A0AAJ0H772_9PEZI|nr:SGNH hydrolase-type esterase domain-containing protein [Lasiosphaeria hispida]